jgi:hypothetical protein
MYVPPLPSVYTGELCYPIGTIRGGYTLRELRYAISVGCTVIQIHRVAYSTEFIYPFESFIGTLWAMREAYKQTEDPRQLFAKLLMNNLYGRLGMRDDLTRTDIYPCDLNVTLKKQPKSSWYTQDQKLYLTYERAQPHRNTWTNVVWAAQITAEARIRLHKAMMLQGDSLVYCDTDSIFSTSPIHGLSEGLGGLRPDGEYQAAVIAAPKLYSLQDHTGEWKAKARGVPREFALTFLRDGIARYKEPIKPLSQARRQIAAGTWVDTKTENQYLPARRLPISPELLDSDYGYSDTLPPWSGPSA